MPGTDLLFLLVLIACFMLALLKKDWKLAVSAMAVMVFSNLSTMAMIFRLPAAGLFLKLFAVAFFASTFRVLLYLFESWTAKREAKQQRRREEEYREWKAPNGCDDYAVLGLPPGATLQEVKAAYRRLAKVYHPDAGGDPEIFVKIHAAYQKLVGR